MTARGETPGAQIKLINEKEIFQPDYKLPGSPDSMPYRKLWDVSFYNNKAELISLHEIAKSGPFIGVASAEKSEGVKEIYKNRNFKISLNPVIEYSLELPYGRQARIWVTTEVACYRIMSVSANYISYWQPFYEMVCFSGHVVNILLNYRGPVMLFKLVSKIAKLSGKTADEVYTLLRTHRKFIHDLLKEQNLTSKIRKEYTALQSDAAMWEKSWLEHSQAAEKKTEKKDKLNILSFFRPLKEDENGLDSLNSSNNSINSSQSVRSTKPSMNIDDTSSLLSISEDESATYIEFPNETHETDSSFDNPIKKHIGSSFTSANVFELSMSEIEVLGSTQFKCPICKITYKVCGGDCLSALSLHLHAHRADFNFKREKEPLLLDDGFEVRFNNFRNDLQKFIDEDFSYAPNIMKFERKLDFSPQFIDRPMAEYKTLLESELDINVPRIGINPIKIIKFNSNTGPNPVQRTPPPLVAPPIPKKPRTKKATPAVGTSTTGEISAPSASVTIESTKSGAAPDNPGKNATILTGVLPASPQIANVVSMELKNSVTLSKTTPLNTVQNPKPGPVASNSLTPQTSIVSKTTGITHNTVPPSTITQTPLQIPKQTPAINSQLPKASPVTANPNLVKPAVMIPNVSSTQTSPSSLPNPPASKPDFNNSTQSPQLKAPLQIHASTGSSPNNSPVNQFSSLNSPNLIHTLPHPNPTVLQTSHAIVNPKPPNQKPDMNIEPINLNGKTDSTVPLLTTSESRFPVPVPIELISTDVPTFPSASASDLNSTISFDGKHLGCPHYRLSCKFYAECCKKWFPCRFCHDDVSNHKLNRHETRYCLCMHCGTSQIAAGRCCNPKCKSLMAFYFCNKCKFWDNDPSKLIYHCDGCGICRTGLRNQYNHCYKCKKCFPVHNFDLHKCVISEQSDSKFSSPNPNSIKLVLNLSRSPSPINQSGPQMAQNSSVTILTDSNSKSAILAPTETIKDVKSSVDLTGYVNQLKNSLTDSRNKEPIPSKPSTSSAQRRSCWNCLNILPDQYDNTNQSQYCHHCSAIIE